MVEIRWTNQSLDDIENIAQFIAKDSVRYAEIQVSELFNAVLILEKLPKTGRVVPEIGEINLRELIVGNYRIIYSLKSTHSIDILTIHHTKRVLKKKRISGVKP